MQPQPLPGQVFVRPGIDDRPDYEKTLTEETKAALKRLAVQQNPRVPEASNERPEVQQTLINTEKLCAQLCLAYNLNPDKALKKHQDFMEKVCPARLINEGRWDEFCAAVKQKYTELKAADAEN